MLCCFCLALECLFFVFPIALARLWYQVYLILLSQGIAEMRVELSLGTPASTHGRNAQISHLFWENLLKITIPGQELYSACCQALGSRQFMLECLKEGRCVNRSFTLTFFPRAVINGFMAQALAPHMQTKKLPKSDRTPAAPI